MWMPDPAIALAPGKLPVTVTRRNCTRKNDDECRQFQLVVFTGAFPASLVRVVELISTYSTDCAPTGNELC